MACEAPGGSCRIRNGGPHCKALPLKPCKGIGHQPGFAAMQVRASCYVQHQTIRCFKGDQGRVTVTPVGKRRKQCSFQLRGFTVNLKLRNPGPGIGQGITRSQPTGNRSCIKAA